MIRLLFILLLIFGLFIFNEYMKDNVDFVNFDLLDYQIEVSFLFLFNLLIVLLFLAFYWGQIWFFVIHIPSRLKNKASAKRLNEGMNALFKGYEALSAGDGLKAEKFAKKSEKFLAEHPLTELLLAETSHLNGDEKMAALQFKKLSQNEQTPFIGLRGLLAQAYRLGHYGEALELAEKAYKIKPKSVWVLQMLFEVYQHNGLYEKAYKLLPSVKNQNFYSQEQIAVFEASLCVEMAKQNRLENVKTAQKWVEKGLKAIKNFVPLILLEADILKANGQLDKCEKTLANFWRENPNEDVLSAWKALFKTTETKTYLKKAESLTKSLINEAHGALAMATIYIEEKEFEKARALLVDCLKMQKNKQAYALLSEVDDEIKGAGSGYKWLKKSVENVELPTLCEGFVQAHQKWIQTYTQKGSAKASPAESEQTLMSTTLLERH